MKTTLLFDLDGTLLDTLDDLTNSVNATLTHYGYPLRDKSEIRQMVGHGTKELMEKAIGLKLNESEFIDRFEYFTTHYNLHKADLTKPYPGIYEMLDALKKRGFQMAVISNKPDLAVKSLVNELFPNYFIYAQGVGSDLLRKPEKAFIQKVLSALNVSEEACYLIGDSDTDIITAQVANIPVIACLWGFRDLKDLAPMNPDFIIGSPNDLLKVI